jgi:ribose transport system ATP-binding protein
MAVAAGSLQPQAGVVQIAGSGLDHFTPKASRQLGLRIVRQHPALLPDLTVAENLALGVDPDQRVLRSDLNPWAVSSMEFWGMKIDPTAAVADIPLPQQFVLEITKATLSAPKVLILDEPTEHLGAQEVDLLYAMVESLREKGTGVVYISHRIPEVQRFASRITVLRDGKTQGTFATAGVTESEIVTLALGRSVSASFPDKPVIVDRPDVLRVESLSGPGFHDVSFTARSGEIVGLAGIDGSGQRQVAAALAGAGRATGTVTVSGEILRLGSVQSARRAGVSFVPDDRKTAGLFTALSVAENITAAQLPRLRRFGIIDRLRVRKMTTGAIADFGIKAPSIDAEIGSLSGGNQQKSLMARVVLDEPRVLVADEPTQGVDAGARVQIYQTIRSLCDDGSAAVVVSSDAVELAGLSDRVLVFSRGSVIAELAGTDVTAERITEAALTSTVLRGSETVKRRRRWFAGSSGLAPSVVVAVAILALGVLAWSSNPFYATEFNISNLLTLFAPLALVAMGQLCALVLGGIDLSVGPVMGLTVVVCSFLIPSVGAIPGILMAIVSALIVAAAVGGVNGWLVSGFKMSPVIATLATYMAVLGVGQVLRPSPGGVISADFALLVQASWGAIPVAAVVAVLIAIGLQLALKRTGWGVRLRAAGSDPAAAAWLGIKVERVRLFGYILAAALASAGGILLAAQTGIGDPASGTSFTFASVTAVVLGGASIYGGRGSFVGALLGAALVAQINNVTTFLGLESAWQYWLLAGLTLAAAGIYSRLGRVTR